jgi:hypothetical protein
VVRIFLFAVALFVLLRQVWGAGWMQVRGMRGPICSGFVCLGKTLPHCFRVTTSDTPARIIAVARCRGLQCTMTIPVVTGMRLVRGLPLSRTRRYMLNVELSRLKPPLV